MADPIYTVTNPKGLTAEDFKSLAGSSLHETMMRNRMRVSVNGYTDAKSAATNSINKWLRNNCGTFYFFDQNAFWVYIEGDADAVNFKMFFHDMAVDIPKPPEEPSKPVAKPASVPIRNRPQRAKPNANSDFIKDLIEEVNKRKGGEWTDEPDPYEARHYPHKDSKSKRGSMF